MSTNSSTVIEGIRRGRVFVPVTDTPADRETANVVAAELLRLGFIVHPDRLEGADEATVIGLVELASEVTGADRNWTPVYKNFPKEVREMPLHVQYVNQIIHYLSGGTIQPLSIAEVRDDLPLAELFTSGRRLEVVKGGEHLVLVAEIVTKPVAMSEQDRDYVIAAIRDENIQVDALLAIYQDSSNRENAQVLLEAIEFTRDEVKDFIAATNHPDGLLRLILAVYGEPRQAGNTMDAVVVNDRFERTVRNLLGSHTGSVMLRHVPTTVRKAFLKRLGEVTKGYNADGLVHRLSLWRRVLSPLSASAWAKTAESKHAVGIVFGEVEHRTFASVLEAAYASGDGDEVVRMLSNSTGLLLRNATRIARTGAIDALVGEIAKNGSKARLTTLISAYNGILNADSEQARVVKTAGVKNATVQRTAGKVGKRRINRLTAVIKAAIGEKFAELDAPLIGTGNGDYPVTLVERDVSAGDRVLNRGEVVARVKDSDSIRFFQHWKTNANQDGYVDGGVTVLNGSFDVLGVSSWNQHGDWATYSGDTHVQPNSSAVEFYDVVFSETRKRFEGAKYLVYSIVSYSGHNIKDTDIFAGVSLRDHANDQKGEIWDPRTVVSAARLTNDGTDNILLAVDMESGDVIWLDTSSGQRSAYGSATNLPGISEVAASELGQTKLTWSELAKIAAEAIGADTDSGVDVDKDLLSRV